LLKPMIKFLKIIYQQKLKLIVLGILVFEFIFPHYVLAIEPKTSIILPNFVIKPAETDGVFLVKPLKDSKVVRTYTVPITAYSSTIDQTDNTPCITANGFDLCAHNQEDVIAANFLSFGAKVRIPEYFGDQIFTVQDRMNARYYYRADIWMKQRRSAVAWGIRYATIEVIE